MSGHRLRLAVRGEGVLRSLPGMRATSCLPGPGNRLLPEVARPETRDDVDEACQHQGPCRLKVEIPAPAILVGQVRSRSQLELSIAMKGSVF